MKIKRILSAVLLAGLAFGARAGEYTQYVNTAIGTGGHGHVFYGANVPFGLVQLGPTMVTRGWDWCSGYHISDNIIIGFGHTHLSGTGIGDLGDIGLLPVVSEDESRTTIDRSTEKCVPGFYTVVTGDGVKAELTATSHAALHLDPSRPLCRHRLDIHEYLCYAGQAPRMASVEQRDRLHGRQSRCARLG